MFSNCFEQYFEPGFDDASNCPTAPVSSDVKYERFDPFC